MTSIRITIERTIEIDPLDYVDDAGHLWPLSAIVEHEKGKAEMDAMEFVNAADIRVTAVPV